MTAIDHVGPHIQNFLFGEASTLLISHQDILTNAELRHLMTIDAVVEQRANDSTEASHHLAELGMPLFLGTRVEPLVVGHDGVFDLVERIGSGLKTGLADVTISADSKLRAFSVRMVTSNSAEGSKVNAELQRALPTAALGGKALWASTMRVMSGISKTHVSVYAEVTRSELYRSSYLFYANPWVQHLIEKSDELRRKS